MRVLLAVAGLLAAMAASGQVYKWTDSAGKVHYGDKPPEDARTRELRIPSYDGPVEVRDWGDVLRGKTVPGSGPGLTMYATSWCGYCKRARAYFAQGLALAPAALLPAAHAQALNRDCAGIPESA